MAGIVIFFDNLDSVFLYYLIFFIAFVFFMLADCSEENRAAKLYTLLGVLVLCIFAGARDISVGFDAKPTIELYFKPFENVSFANLSNLTVRGEPIYAYVSFFLHKLTHNPWIFLFTTQLLTAGPVAVALYRHRKKVLISIGMLVYMLLFYQFGLNIIRQSIAAAFLFWSFVEYLQKSYLLSGLLSFLGILFHSSCVLGVSLFFFVLVLAKIKKIKTRMIVIFACIILLSLFLFSWKSVFLWMINNGLINSVYSKYVLIFSDGLVGGHRFLVKDMGVTGILRIMVCTLSLVFTIYILDFKIKKYDYEMLSMKYAMFLSVLLYTLIYYMLNTIMGWRITIFTEYLQILLFARIYAVLSNGTVLYKNGKIRIRSFYTLGFVILPLIYNILIIMIRHSAGTIPYLFS